MKDDVKITDCYPKGFCAIFSIQVLDEAHPQCAGVSRIELLQGGIDRLLSLCNLRRAIRCWWGLGHGPLDDGVGLFFGAAVSLPRPVYVDGAVDGDAPEPEEDAAVVALKGLDALKSSPEGVLEDVLSELRNRQPGKDRLAVELLCKPLEEHTSCLPIPTTDPRDDRLFLLDWGQIAGVFARQGCLLSSLPPTREEAQSYTNGRQTRP